ncbi:hypothetical protein [Rhizobium halophytocola]|uniref:Minor tail protein n=1 Tax=Rhizobium halophytocola TaxID=735519 RepID=A0ABS4DT05_9HYPH|nr:hypothetical protein [Rhizobium halophytocola]MBP1848833.1 hypothetical protein [Rhizobium halophytocola]
MTTYTLKVRNLSEFAKSYVWFMEPPIVTSKGGSTPVFTNAWVTFNAVTSGSNDTVIYTDETFAYWSKTPIQVAPGTTMGEAGDAPVDTSLQDTLSFFGSVATGGVGFGPVTHGGASTGSYSIITTCDFNRSNGYLFGLARPGSIPGIPSPVATFVAQPNETYNVTPVIKFFVSDGLFVPGAIIDYGQVSTKAQVVDFTGRSQTSVVVTHGENGDFSAEYY